MKDRVLCVENFQILHYYNNGLSLSRRKGRGEGIKEAHPTNGKKFGNIFFLITLFNLLLQSNPLTARLDVAKYQLMRFIFLSCQITNTLIKLKRLLTKNN